MWLVLASLFAGFSIAAKYTSGLIVVPILIFSLICDFEKNKLLNQQLPSIKANRRKVKLNNELGFLAILTMDAIVILMEAWLKVAK